VPEAPVINLHPPRLQERRALLMAGLQEHYTPQTANTIPEQWKRLPFGKIPGQLGHMAYGVAFNLDEKSGEFDYFCGVEIATISPAHKALATYKSPQQKYAIFCHRENVSPLGCRLRGRRLPIPRRARRISWSITAKALIRRREPATWRSGFRLRLDCFCGR
jgi:hypothetical protein